MDEESSNSDCDYDAKETSKKSADFKSTFKHHALPVLEKVLSVPRLPEVRSVRGIFSGCFEENNSDLCEMDHSDISTTNSDTNSIDCKHWTVKCLESYEELKNKCELLGLKLVDHSEDVQAEGSSDVQAEGSSDVQAEGSSDVQAEGSSDVQAEGSSLNPEPMKMNLAVNCLYSYEELVNTSEELGLKFVDCSSLDTQADKQSLYSEAKKMDLTVNCLYSYAELMDQSEELGLTFVDCTQDKTFEVDLILQDKLEEGKKYYLVKWKYYNMDANTWEPDYHMIGCDDMLSYYEYLKNSENSFDVKQFFYFVRELVSRRPYDILTIMKLLSIATSTSEDFIKKKDYTFTQLKYEAKEILSYSLQSLREKRNELLKLMRFAEKRKHVLIKLREWECDINDSNPASYVKVENDVDLEEVPTDFEFIQDYVCHGIDITDEPAVFCKCDDCFNHKDLCCPNDSEARFPYNKFGRLQLLPGYPIYECNKLCKCGIDCVNRVVQHGPKLSVAIFRTSNGCGWGLKALEVIQKDQFVLEYLGEILTSEDAEIRGQEYDTIGRSYLFDLDYGDCKYTVDAGHLGNASHFINHSCEPNLHVFAVWINCQDPQLPRLAFFAKKKIKRGEELTFDYKMYLNKDKSGSSTRALGKMLCKCNSRRCRKYLC